MNDVRCGSDIFGATLHFTGELFRQSADINILHVLFQARCHQEGGHSRMIHASTNPLASACEVSCCVVDMRNLRNLFFVKPTHEKVSRGRSPLSVILNAAQINRVRPRAS
jgi:hypothetical protein